ncbi:MAG: hypothetical protein JRH15_21975 [Deltaproteobacteria bacterium]|nr:hypothetical protein [Deltaproteobacteria bacterium]
MKFFKTNNGMQYAFKMLELEQLVFLSDNYYQFRQRFGKRLPGGGSVQEPCSPGLLSVLTVLSNAHRNGE